jgi:hypothetical protein
MKDKSITPNTLSVCLNMLLNVDKNNRDIKSTFTKDLTDWSDEKLNAELSKFKGEQ